MLHSSVHPEKASTPTSGDDLLIGPMANVPFILSSSKDSPVSRLSVQVDVDGSSALTSMNLAQ